MSLRTSGIDPAELNTNGQVFGTSKYFLPFRAGMVVEAEIHPHCRICRCFVWDCDGCPYCISPEVNKRTYARVYENRIEANFAWTLCGCSKCVNKHCVNDDVVVYYFDKPPTSACSAPFPCCCLPCTCCGKPAVYVFNPNCCGCVSCTRCCGQTIAASPCAMKCCICCGPVCCFPCSYPLLAPLERGQVWISGMKAAYLSYANKRGIPKPEQAEFYDVTPGCFCLIIKTIPDNLWNEGKARGLQEMRTQTMDRGDLYEESETMNPLMPPTPAAAAIPLAAASNSGEYVVPLPSGSVGIRFSKDSCPPVISTIAEDSPIQDRVHEGTVVLALELIDGTKYTDLNSTDLRRTLRDTSSQPGRKLIVVEGKPFGPGPETENDFSASFNFSP